MEGSCWEVKGGTLDEGIGHGIEDWQARPVNIPLLSSGDEDCHPVLVFQQRESLMEGYC